ncbi:hypothetical protein D5289_04525 [Lactiplantibacillus plantarum]|nr:hypothetical protein D5289_04525 [Lactiplantibacillus plantarum]RDG02868.1 hypothetical protein DQM19_01055 [Lactiplantibacillus plantarum]
MSYHFILARMTKAQRQFIMPAVGDKKSIAQFWIGTNPKLSDATQLCSRLLRQLTINYQFSRESSSIIAERRGYCCCQSCTIACTVDLPAG